MFTGIGTGRNEEKVDFTYKNAGTSIYRINPGLKIRQKRKIEHRRNTANMDKQVQNGYAGLISYVIYIFTRAGHFRYK
jgi:hypothetical protein